jgi:hypothetical protein
MVSLDLLTKKMHKGWIFCDFTKTSDYVNREILSVQLQFYGIWDIDEYWFRCFVRNRRQKVEITPTNSTGACRTLKHGVPQESILVFLLFMLYINYLFLRINPVSESALFAGDSSVIIASRNVDDFCSM